MRWNTLVLGLVFGAGAVAGCKQQCFMTECDYAHYRDLALPANLECDPSFAVTPPVSRVGAPPTVLELDREPRYLTLAEAIAAGLERGTVGSPALNGTTNTNLVSFSGRTVFAPENNVRVLALQPAIISTDIEASLAKFDVRWDTNVTWSTTDRPVGGNFIQSFQNGESAQIQSSLLKPLPTGGVAGVTFRTDYTFLNAPPAGFTNPSYRPQLTFQFEQPLLQGFGDEINQLRSTHPGSVLTPFPTGGRVEGVLITRIRFDQARAEFERNVHQLLVNVEVAYWNLYGSYYALYSREQALRQAFEAWKINKERYDAGRIAIQEVAQTRQQYELFRAQRIQALGQVLENERALRALMGLAIEDGQRLIPIDQPTLTPYRPDWNTAINEALALRPELILARNDLKFRQLDVVQQKDQLKPDLRFTSQYNFNGLGMHLDGGSGDPNNAFHSLASGKFTDYTLGLRLDVPIGFRDAHAALRASRLNLAQSYAVLQDQEARAHQFLALEYSNVIEFNELIAAQRAQREAAAIFLGARFKEFLAGRGTLDFLLEAQRVYADALRDEFASITQYNNSLITFEYAKGTILNYDNVVISEGPLPTCAQVRAVEHERERTKALVLREHAAPAHGPTPRVSDGVVTVGIPSLPPAPPSLPKLFDALRETPPAPNAPATEQLPTPRPATEQLPTPRPAPEPEVKADSPAPQAVSLAPPAPRIAAPAPETPVPVGSEAVPSTRPAIRLTEPRTALPESMIPTALGRGIRPADPTGASLPPALPPGGQ